MTINYKNKIHLNNLAVVINSKWDLKERSTSKVAPSYKVMQEPLQDYYVNL